MPEKNKKIRLDLYLTEKGFFETKSKAQSAVMAGQVKIGGIAVTKAGTLIALSDNPEIEVESLPYVSRGGLKLEKAIEEFGINVEGKICLDAGASTGGFTDCLLKKGAKKVYAVDVGYGQLDWRLRNDGRVVVVERTNIRNVSKEELFKKTDASDREQSPEIATLDLSFISITKVLENIKNLINPDQQEIIALIKPQFEAGKEDVPKKGVVRDKNVHVNVIKTVADYAAKIGFNPVNLAFSPVKGPAGNIEYLIYLKSSGEPFNEKLITETVDKAHETLQ